VAVAQEARAESALSESWLQNEAQLTAGTSSEEKARENPDIATAEVSRRCS
jgi:hypothetical protein